mmetsp:Transcript_88449/g.249258  ORF Transcript_88449/g.249258 Transcript_88449/m.249258 type:complete len:207 (-) Transcript_88449:475-1095(-)
MTAPNEQSSSPASRATNVEARTLPMVSSSPLTQAEPFSFAIQLHTSVDKPSALCPKKRHSISFSTSVWYSGKHHKASSSSRRQSSCTMTLSTMLLTNMSAMSITFPSFVVHCTGQGPRAMQAPSSNETAIATTISKRSHSIQKMVRHISKRMPKVGRICSRLQHRIKPRSSGQDNRSQTGEAREPSRIAVHTVRKQSASPRSCFVP